jgi:hypothetical protein
MKTIEMLITKPHKNAAGYMQVFGPAGKQFRLDDKTADELIDSGAAKDTVVKVKKSAQAVKQSNSD